MNLHGMVYTVAIQQATRQCLTKIKECPHVHVWAGTRTIFFKLNTTVLGDEGGIKNQCIACPKTPFQRALLATQPHKFKVEILCLL